MITSEGRDEQIARSCPAMGQPPCCRDSAGIFMPA
jgi:hypothetical protein